MTYYQVISSVCGDYGIRETEFVKVTEHFGIKANGRREALRSNYDDWFPTREQAIEYQYQKLQGRLRSAQRSVEEATLHISTFRTKFDIKLDGDKA